jgi:acetoacetyl-CoA synthetase
VNILFRLNLFNDETFDFEENYDDLYKWSIDNHLAFWEEFWHFSGIIHSKSYEKVLDKPDVSMDNLPFKWFDGALMNYAENLLRYDDERIAVYSYGEAFKSVKTITFKDLREKVRVCQIALRKAGVLKGDCVAGKYFHVF